MHIEIDYYSRRKDNGKLRIHHLTLTEEEICAIAKKEVGECTSSGHEYVDFTIDKVVCD